MTNVASSSGFPANLATKSRVLRWPNRALLRVFLWKATWVTSLWFVVYGGANWVTALHGYRVRLWTALDLSIPYVPWAAAIYLSVLPMLWMCPFVLHTREELRTFAKCLSWLIVISGVGFLILPGCDAHSPHIATGYSGLLANFADQLNLSYNYLPSLHVGLAVVCAYFYGRKNPRKLGRIWWIWATAIALSTLVTHQHYLVDVMARSTLGMLCASNCKCRGN